MKIAQPMRNKIDFLLVGTIFTPGGAGRAIAVLAALDGESR
jgi:hypothetical protein